MVGETIPGVLIPTVTHHQNTFSCPEFASLRAVPNCYFGAPHCDTTTSLHYGCGLKGRWWQAARRVLSGITYFSFI